MKHKLLLLGLMLTAAFSASAQSVVGDMNDDGDITAVDVAQVVNTALGKTAKRYIDAYQVNNTLIVGTWYKSKTESITFNEDGTTDYGTGYTYEYMPGIPAVLIYNATGTAVTALDIYKLTADQMILSPRGSSSLLTYVKAKPVQLVTSITLSASSLTLATGDSETLTATVSPSDADNKSVTWATSNSSVATIVDGTVLGVGVGTATITCTASDGSGVNAMCTVTVTSSDPYLLPGKFSVSATKQVQFTKSNLYWDGSAFKFEENQTDYPTSWDASHVSLFYWTNVTDYLSGNTSYMPYAETSYSYGSQSTTDKFWCGEDNPLTVEGTSDLYALTGGSSGEWYYLIKSRTNASSLYKYGVTVTNGGTSYSNCIIIAPDDFSGTLASSYTLDEVNSLGLVCLPAAGYRRGSSLYGVGSFGDYWSATPNSSSLDYAYDLNFNSGDFIPADYILRSRGESIRLVRGI